MGPVVDYACPEMLMVKQMCLFQQLPNITFQKVANDSTVSPKLAMAAREAICTNIS